MESKLLSISWKIILIPPCIVLIASLVFPIFAPTILVSSEFNTFVGQQWTDFIKSNAQVAKYLLLILREVGVMIFIISFISIVITLTAYRKGEKWSWYVLLIECLIGYGFVTILDLYLGDIPFALFTIIMLIISLIALTMGAKGILRKAS